MQLFNNGLFEYSDNLKEKQKEKFPDSLQLVSPSLEAVLLRLFVGNIKIRYAGDSKQIIQNTNYTKLEFEKKSKLTYSSFNNIFGTNITEEPGKLICDKYFLKNRKNYYIHNQMLFEISSYFREEKRSPVAAFVHLYRCLEFMSYSFPMIYASTSRDYRGTYNSLKNFMGGDSSGELAFMKKFIAEIYKNDPILNYQFDINVPIQNIEEVKKECRNAFTGFPYDFEDSTFSVKFEHMMPLFINIRNRYFHFLIGQRRNNLIATSYDINEFLRAFNPHFMNWIAIVFCKIVQHGFDSFVE